MVTAQGIKMADREVQKRLAAILAADIAGYTRLIEADSDGTVAAWHAARSDVIDPGIAEFNGRIVKHTGDGFLAEFPTAQDAVRCAVAMQEGLAPSSLEFRIGVNLGDIIDDGDDIHGEGVNVAARLEGLAEPGGICISGEAHALVRNRIDVPFRDLGEHNVKHVTHPVQVYAIGVEAAATPLDTPLLDKPSIAVLPFDNLSGDPEQEYFSDGMAEDLITDLSKISGLFVAARNSSFSFKGQMPDVKEVAQKLDVAFVLEGSVRKMGDRLRINAQLIESADGGHVWAERYDGDIAEIFDFQDRIREEIVAALKIQLNPTDAARTKPNRTGNIEAYDLFLQGKGKYFRYDPDALSEAFSCLERSIELDPEFADAYSYLASCHLMTYGHRWLTVDENLEQALWAAEKAVSLDSDSPIAHARLGFIQNWRHDYDDAEKSFENAVSLGPDVAEVLVYDAMHNLHIGNPELGMELARKAIALDPFTPVTDFVLGIGHQLLGQLNEAVVKLEAARDRTPKQLWVRLQLVAAYMEMGQATEASREIAVIAQNSPEMTVEIIEKMAPYRSADVIRRFVDFLRQAGLPEGARAEAAITPPALADKPSIAVLPFDNLSGDAGQDFIGDGLTEDIIAG